jgi:protein ImuB
MGRRERAAAGARVFRGVAPLRTSMPPLAARAAGTQLLRPAGQGELDLQDTQPVSSESGASTVVASWAALHLPALMLDALTWQVPYDRRGQGAARVVLQPDAVSPRVLAANDAARARSIAPGLSIAAALALEPGLEALPRNLSLERKLLQRLGEIGLDFSPRVSLEPPDGLLLEVRGSFALFGGAQALARALIERCSALGVDARLAMAPTPLAALALARVGAAPSCAVSPGEAHAIVDAARLAGALAPLPLAALRWPEQIIDRLGAIGVTTLGEALRLPRAGFARRFGVLILESLDRLVGRRPDPRRPFRRRERFVARCEPSFELSGHDSILRQIDPLLGDLEVFLRRRQSAITVLELRLHHRASEAVPSFTRLVLRLASAEFVAKRFAALLAERLAPVVLPAPVVCCTLRGGELRPMLARSEPAWQPGEHGGGAVATAPAFIERLRARLGAEAVYGLRGVPEHRPERAWRVAEPLLSDTGETELPAVPPRPLWLLRVPRQLASGPRELDLVEGPERIESGWWDDGDVARDYYVALDRDGARLWVFRERCAPHGWYLHGVFG